MFHFFLTLAKTIILPDIDWLISTGSKIYIYLTFSALLSSGKALKSPLSVCSYARAVTPLSATGCVTLYESYVAVLGNYSTAKWKSSIWRGWHVPRMGPCRSLLRYSFQTNTSPDSPSGRQVSRHCKLLVKCNVSQTHGKTPPTFTSPWDYIFTHWRWHKAYNGFDDHIKLSLRKMAVYVRKISEENKIDFSRRNQRVKLSRQRPVFM